MKVRYDKLWRLMKDNKMKKSDLSKAAEISSYAMIGDLMEVIEED